MKKTLLTLALTLSLVTGFTTVSTFAAVNTANTTQNNGSRVFIKVYEDGAIWVYVYTEDGTFVTKYVEENL
ncbi:MAG TPA: hypothetical protein PK605_14940 [Ignavibacteria bacterium]|nr:hypothetical protein [Ignavibacteria bacterium]HAX49749.1 hypothetical protein [Bacteroidota bacterium]HRE10919.1 hypothetical protein [Ignavibacteria bacterium]HRF66703.1 hypothetical protein [Ignavibacteria bacterium]HRJ05697.1 hypothetical protein [Ignavibacteria bacterium]